MTVAIMEKLFVKFFHILKQFTFSTSERELDYYYYKMVNLRVASRAAKRLKT